MDIQEAPPSKRGSWLVIGLVAVAVILVVLSQRYHPVPKEGWREILEQTGIPAAREGMDLSRAGRALLSAAEQQEMDALYAESLQGLEEHERQAFVKIAQKGKQATAREITEGTETIQKALRTLPPDKQTRLFELIEKAVRLQYEKELRSNE